MSSQVKIEVGGWYLVSMVLFLEDRSRDYPAQVTGLDRQRVYFEKIPKPGWSKGTPLSLSKKSFMKIARPLASC